MNRRPSDTHIKEVTSSNTNSCTRGDCCTSALLLPELLVTISGGILQSSGALDGDGM